MLIKVFRVNELLLGIVNKGAGFTYCNIRSAVIFL